MREQKNLYADIVIDISHSRLDQSFQYRIPERLQEELEPGNVVLVPFGRGDHPKKGYVLRITDHAACAPEKIKNILQVETQLAGTESKLTALALWMRDRYGSTAVQALRTAEEKTAACAYCFEGEGYRAAGSIPTETSGRPRTASGGADRDTGSADGACDRQPEGDSIRMAPDGRDGTADLRDGADLPDACGAQGAAKSDAAAFRSERIRAKYASSESIPAICSRYDLYKLGKTGGALPAFRGDRERENSRLYGADRTCVVEGRAGDSADPGDLADVPECDPVLSSVW